MLNVTKIEKMVFDPKAIGDTWPVVINSVSITQVISYKYGCTY